MRRTIVLAALALVLTCAAGQATALAAAQRFASPSGTIVAPCTQVSPCDLTTAIQGASAGDDVTVTAGSYTLTSMITDSVALTIHGVAGQPAPVITSSAFTVLQVSNPSTTLRRLDLRDTAAGGGALITNGTLAEQISARGGGSGNGTCDIQAGTLRDSVCVASDSGAAGVLAGTGSGTITLRNVTAINTNPTAGDGLLANGQGSPQLIVNATNVIAHGVTDIAAKGVGGSDSAKVNVDHSNYVTTSPAAGSSIVDGGGQQTSAPVFVNAGAFDYHEAANSPTIGAGVDSAANGTLDLDADPRQIATTDIGADEFIPAPTISLAKATVTGSTSAIVSATINPNGIATTYHVNYGKTASLGTATQTLTLPAATTGQAVQIPLNELDFGTTYHFTVTASNATRSATTVDQSFTTIGVSHDIPTTQPPVTVPPPPPTVPTTPTPAIRSLSLSPSRFASSGHSRKVHHGTSIHVTLSQAASVIFTVDMQSTGRIVGTQCRKQTSSNRKKAKCALSKTIGTFSHPLATAATNTGFSGKVRGHALAPGSYTLTAVATAAGKKSAPRLVKFTVVRG